MATSTERLGTLERVGENARLRFERLLRHPRERVWRALTEPDYLRVWFPTDIVGDRTPGAALRFPFPDQALPAMTGEMLAYEPPTLLVLRWGPDDVLRFELAEAADDAGGTGWCALTLVVDFAPLGKAARTVPAARPQSLDLLAVHLAGGELWAPGQRSGTDRCPLPGGPRLRGLGARPTWMAGRSPPPHADRVGTDPPGRRGRRWRSVTRLSPGICLAASSGRVGGQAVLGIRAGGESLGPVQRLGPLGRPRASTWCGSWAAPSSDS